MHSMSCALHEDGPFDIAVVWTPFNKRFRLDYRGETLVDLNYKELKKEPMVIVLPGGHEITLEYSPMGPPRIYDSNGHLPGSGREDTHRLQTIWILLFSTTLFLLMIASLVILNTRPETSLRGDMLIVAASGVTLLALSLWAFATPRQAPWGLAVGVYSVLGMAAGYGDYGPLLTVLCLLGGAISAMGLFKTRMILMRKQRK